jgi:hypothetical protein
MEDLALFWSFLLPMVAIVAGCAVAIVKSMARSRVRELEIRERIAMIERGLVPPPEVDPRGFYRAMNRYERGGDRPRHGGSRHRRSGIMSMAVGFALMALIGIAGEAPREGIGVGGAFVIFGLAFFVSSLFDDAQASPWGSQSSPPTIPPAQDSQPPQWKPPSPSPGPPA